MDSPTPPTKATAPEDAGDPKAESLRLAAELEDTRTRASDAIIYHEAQVTHHMDALHAARATFEVASNAADHLAASLKDDSPVADEVRQMAANRRSR